MLSKDKDVLSTDSVDKSTHPILKTALFRATLWMTPIQIIAQNLTVDMSHMYNKTVKWTWRPTECYQTWFFAQDACYRKVSIYAVQVKVHVMALIQGFSMETWLDIS